MAAYHGGSDGSSGCESRARCNSNYFAFELPLPPDPPSSFLATWPDYCRQIALSRLEFSAHATEPDLFACTYARRRSSQPDGVLRALQDHER